MSGQADHGGAFFNSIGVDLRHLERAGDVVSADVLDAWFDPSPNVVATLREHLPFLLKTSPPNHAEGLVAELAERRGLPAGCILTGAGSSSLLFHCLPRLLPHGARVLLLDPMYSEYRHLVSRVMEGQALPFVLRPENGFALEPDRLADTLSRLRPDALAIVNPNNPTGRLCPLPEVERLIELAPPGTRIIVDETYIEYAGAAHSLERRAAASPDVVVIKSMSKAYALSGERVAYLVAHPSVCERLRVYLPPWPVGLSAQAAALEALRDPAYYQARYAETTALRLALADALARLPGVHVFPSEANFVLLRCQGAPALAAALRERRIFVREFPAGQTALDETYLRISVKDEATNGRVLSAMRELLA
jgi:histidinol-phosphate/aromatic aminotransferase/cobyric acid decarboxylase-like protein